MLQGSAEPLVGEGKHIEDGVLGSVWCAFGAPSELSAASATALLRDLYQRVIVFASRCEGQSHWGLRILTRLMDDFMNEAQTPSCVLSRF